MLGSDVAFAVTPAERASLDELLEQRLLTPPEYRALSRHARGARLERLIDHLEAFRAGLLAE